MIDSSESSRCVWLNILKLLDQWTEPWNRILHSQHRSSSSPRSYISVYCRAGIIITASEASTWKLILFLSDGPWIFFFFFHFFLRTQYISKTLRGWTLFLVLVLDGFRWGPRLIGILSDSKPIKQEERRRWGGGREHDEKKINERF